MRSGEVCSVEEANSEEPLFWSFRGERHFGRPLSEVLTAKNGVRSFVDPDFIVGHHQDNDGVYIAVSSNVDSETQLRAVFYGEYLTIAGRYILEIFTRFFLYNSLVDARIEFFFFLLIIYLIT